MYHERRHHSAEMRMVAEGMPGPDTNNQVWFKFKTRLCVHYSKSGGCFYGDRCQFAHGKEELRRAMLPVQPPQPQLLHHQQLFQQPVAYMHHHLMAQQQQRQRQHRNRNNYIRQPNYKLMHHNAHMKQNKKKSEKYGLKTKIGKTAPTKNKKAVNNAQSAPGPSNDNGKATKECASPKASKQHNNPKFKTELCRSVVQGTSCAFGDKCIFVHKCDEMYEEVAAKAKEMADEAAKAEKSALAEDGDSANIDVDSEKNDIGENKHSKTENEENKNVDTEHPDRHASEVKAKQSDHEDVPTPDTATVSDALPSDVAKSSGDTSTVATTAASADGGGDDSSTLEKIDFLNENQRPEETCAHKAGKGMKNLFKTSKTSTSTSTSTLEKIDFSTVRATREETCARKAGKGVKNLFKKVPLTFPASWRNAQPHDTDADPTNPTTTNGTTTTNAATTTTTAATAAAATNNPTEFAKGQTEPDLDLDLVMKDVPLATTSMVQPHPDYVTSTSCPSMDTVVGDETSEIECWEMDTATPDTPDCDFRVRLPLFKRLVNSNTSEDFKRLCHSPSKENLKRLWHSATSFS